MISSRNDHSLEGSVKVSLDESIESLLLVEVDGNHHVQHEVVQDLARGQVLHQLESIHVVTLSEDQPEASFFLGHTHDAGELFRLELLEDNCEEPREFGLGFDHVIRLIEVRQDVGELCVGIFVVHDDHVLRDELVLEVEDAADVRATQGELHVLEAESWKGEVVGEGGFYVLRGHGRLFVEGCQAYTLGHRLLLLFSCDHHQKILVYVTPKKGFINVEENVGPGWVGLELVVDVPHLHPFKTVDHETPNSVECLLIGDNAHLLLLS